MKLEIYEPHKVGYVSLDPYEWEYNGRYPRVSELLEMKPDYHRGEAAGEDGMDEAWVKITDEEEYFERLSADLRANLVWGTKIVEDG